jgi:hypothetical protein
MRRLLVIVVAALCASAVSCGQTAPSAQAPSPTAAPQRQAATYLDDVQKIIARESELVDEASAVVIDWEDPTTWRPFIAVWDKIVTSYREQAAQFTATSPPPAFAAANAAAIESYRVAAETTAAFLDAMRAEASLAELNRLWRRQLAIYKANRAVRAALRAGAQESGVPVPPAILDQFPTRQPPLVPSPAPGAMPTGYPGS